MKFFVLLISQDGALVRAWMDNATVVKTLKEEKKIAKIFRSSTDQYASMRGEELVWIDVPTKE